MLPTWPSSWWFLAPLEGVALLALAAAAALAVRSAPAAARHRLWRLALAALPALPLLALVMPGWHVRLPGPALLLPAASGAAGSPWLAPLLLGSWLAGSALLLLRLAVGSGRVAALARTAQPLPDPAWQQELAAQRAALGLSRAVRLRLSEQVATPMTWGALRPLVLLPAEALGWSPERRRMVLLHELAHVRRSDWPWQLAAVVVTALHWWNPLAWLALRELRRESEHACDELVLAAGVRPSAYAATLLALARSRRDRNPALATPLGRPSQLEGRVRALLAPPGRRAPGWPAGVAGAALIAVAVGLAAVEPVPTPVSPGAAPARAGVPPESVAPLTPVGYREGGGRQAGTGSIRFELDCRGLLGDREGIRCYGLLLRPADGTGTLLLVMEEGAAGADGALPDASGALTGSLLGRLAAELEAALGSDRQEIRIPAWTDSLDYEL